MKKLVNINSFTLLALLFTLSACVTAPYDYSKLNEIKPRSILILPPINESSDVKGTYSYYSTVSKPIAETGYYVFPVAVVDQFLKQNGMPGPGEMHQVSLKKLRQVFGADAVLYINLIQYGAKYHIVSSVTTVTAKARLVDTIGGETLWEGKISANNGSGGQGGLAAVLVSAVVKQVVSSALDIGHQMSKKANLMFMGERGLLYGPYHPKSNQPQ